MVERVDATDTEAEGEHCWDQNPECGLGGKTCRPQCPAFRQEKDCWDMDWDALASNLADEQRQVWTSWFKNRCPRCPVYDRLKGSLEK